MKVVVVGTGIVGLSSAWALVRSGRTPVLYDQGSI
ncbi:MAG: FAD-dependent oxidoreductase [Acidiferrobacterales bacterium]